MTKEERKRVIDIYGPDYKQEDIPTYIRKRDEEAREAKGKEIEEEGLN